MPKPTPKGTPKQRHYYWLQLASAHIRKRANRELEPLGMTITQLGALFVIATRPECRLKDLAAELHINASAVTTLAARLERAGLVATVRSPTDRRAFCLGLTPAGRESLEQTRPLVSAMNDELERDFTVQELATVHRFLQRCVSLSTEQADV